MKILLNLDWKWRLLVAICLLFLGLMFFDGGISGIYLLITSWNYFTGPIYILYAFLFGWIILLIFGGFSFIIGLRLLYSIRKKKQLSKLNSEPSTELKNDSH